MLTLILMLSPFAILIFAILWLISLCWDGWKKSKTELKLFFISIIVFLVSIVLNSMLCTKLKTEKLQTARYELVSLQDNSQISGQGRGGLFYLYVSMDTNDIYSYYYKVGDGYQKGKIVSENAIIYEQDNCTPCIIEYSTITKLDMNPLLSGILTFGLFNEETISYDIFVPTGTIVQTFSLDAE